MTQKNLETPVVKNPLLACVLSVILGGSGQIYLGQVKKGIFIILSMLFSAGVITVILVRPWDLFPYEVYNALMTIVWVIYYAITIFGMIDAYIIARRIQENGAVKEWEFFWNTEARNQVFQGKIASVNLNTSAPNIRATTKKQKRALQVFLCHSSSDKPAVEKFYDLLVNEGYDAWLDKKNLLPGQLWQIEIPKAVRNSDVVIVFLSSQSITKEGFVQKEIKIALDTADEKPDETIFIIPAKLENCKVPERLSKYHWVDMFEKDGYERLVKALQTRASSLGIALNPNGHALVK